MASNDEKPRLRASTYTVKIVHEGDSPDDAEIRDVLEEAMLGTGIKVEFESSGTFAASKLLHWCLEAGTDPSRLGLSPPVPLHIEIPCYLASLVADGIAAGDDVARAVTVAAVSRFAASLSQPASPHRDAYNSIVVHVGPAAISEAIVAFCADRTKLYLYKRGYVLAAFSVARRPERTS